MLKNFVLLLEYCSQLYVKYDIRWGIRLNMEMFLNKIMLYWKIYDIENSKI